MSFNIQDHKIEEELEKSTIENELKEDEIYSCTECGSNIEILDIDDKNNLLSFQCPYHGSKTMKLKEYFEIMPKNTFLYSKCSTCKKQQNQPNNNKIFKYCFNCNLILCNNCLSDHDNDHLIIDNNQLNIKCSKHPKNYNKNYCLDCNIHLCEDCLKQRKHMIHKKINIIEIEPSNDEIKILLKLIHEYKSKVSSAILEKSNKLTELEVKHIKEQEKQKEEYKQLIINSKRNLEIELEQNLNNYYYEINKITEKWEKETKKIKEKHKQIEENNKFIFNQKLENLENNNKNEITLYTTDLNEKISHYSELAKINEIIYNTYNKYRDNYFHNKNIINILINYSDKDNNILKEIKNNNVFMESKKQKELNNKIINNNNPKIDIPGIGIDIHGPRIDAGIPGPGLPGFDINGPKINGPAIDIRGPNLTKLFINLIFHIIFYFNFYYINICPFSYFHYFIIIFLLNEIFSWGLGIGD